MALVVLLRGVNVGGHRRFRPSQFAEKLSGFEVVNIGAAGTLVARRPGPRAQFRAALAALLPFETAMMLCDGSELLRATSEHPFGAEAEAPDVVRFVMVLAKAAPLRAPLPVRLPAEGDWLVRLVAVRGRYVFGMYRRRMKTISCLGQVDRLCGAPATTRNWNTMLAIQRVLRSGGGAKRSRVAAMDQR
ncbi:MAG: DUF1697 domain-containing protein [Terriglobales bacterium]